MVCHTVQEIFSNINTEIITTSSFTVINETNDDVSYVYELKKSFKDQLIIEEVSEGIKLQM